MAEFRYAEFAFVAVTLLGVVALLFVAAGGLGFLAGSAHLIYAEPVENASAVDGEIVAFESLTPEQRRLFEEVLAEGRASVPDGASLGPLRSGNGVRYGKELYVLREAKS